MQHLAGGVGINNDLHVGGDITAFSSSDRNLKENITMSYLMLLIKLKRLTGNTFNWKSDLEPFTNNYAGPKILVLLHKES